MIKEMQTLKRKCLRAFVRFKQSAFARKGTLALVAFNVYFKMQNGDQDVKKTIMLTIGGCIAFIALSEALPLFFT